MRQFVLMKLQRQVPFYLSTEDMKKWLLAGQSFLEEFQEIAKGADARKLIVAELAWSSARCLCVNQMEQELWEELEKERRLSLLLRRKMKVRLEGLQMFLSLIRPKAEQDVQVFLHHLSNKLLHSLASSHTSMHSKRALLTQLQRTTLALAPQLVETALESLLDVPQPLHEVRTSQTLGLRNRAEATCTLSGRQLAEAAASCFCLNTSFTNAHLLHICMSVAWDMVKAIYNRFVDRSEIFHLMDFDESFITAREGVIKDMVTECGGLRRLGSPSAGEEPNHERKHKEVKRGASSVDVGEDDVCESHQLLSTVHYIL